MMDSVDVKRSVNVRKSSEDDNCEIATKNASGKPLVSYHHSHCRCKLSQCDFISLFTRMQTVGTWVDNRLELKSANCKSDRGAWWWKNFHISFSSRSANLSLRRQQIAVFCGSCKYQLEANIASHQIMFTLFFCLHIYPHKHRKMKSSP